MSEARTNTSEARPQGAAAEGASSRGKHRGPAAAEDAQTPVHGRHRRPAQEQNS
ncbi:hypothetical protein [Streptomyces sp. bgisy100]|uniref:hypothetical protein n=1 Tax=Streptomyces sp. bgisy100 TaxID=3413783 RepID=UPI003D760786